MRFSEIGLEGAWLIEAVPVVDERGSFARSYCAREFAEHDLEIQFVQHSRSQSAQRGTLRGMHFQSAPYGEAKLVSCVQGGLLDVIVDLRLGSPTYRQWRAAELTPKNLRQMYVPKGFAHGFQTLTDDTVAQYLISSFYVPEASNGVRFDDPSLEIEWPYPPTVVSDKDRGWPLLD